MAEFISGVPMTRAKVVCVQGFLVGVFSVVSPPVFAQTFNVIDLHPSSLGYYMDIALDANDKAYVVFNDQGLTTDSYLVEYATNVSGSWQVIYLPGSTSTDKKPYPSIAVGPDGLPKIAYYDGTVQHPMVIEKTATGWTTPQVIDPAPNTGQFPHITIDALGGVHVSYFHGTGGTFYGGLHYGYRAPGSQTWSNQIIDERAGSWTIGTYNAIAVGPDNVPKAIYSVNEVGGTQYTAVARPGGSPVTCPPDGWCNENIHNQTPDGVGIAIASNGTEHTTFAASGSCFYEKRVGGLWQPEVSVASGVQNPWPIDIALDDAGTPAIAFSRASDVALAITDGSAWAIRSVANAPSPRFVALALNSSYFARIVYDRSFSGDPAYAEQVLPVGVADGPSRPKGVALSNLSANPAHRTARFGVRMDEPQRLRLSVYDVSGRVLRVLADGQLPAGAHEFEWDLRETSGAKVPAGLYFVRLRAGSGEWKARVALVE